MDYIELSKLLDEALSSVLDNTDDKNAVTAPLRTSFNNGAKTMLHATQYRILKKLIEEEIHE